MTNTLVFTIAQGESAAIDQLILDTRTQKNGLRDSLHILAWRALRHFHNCGKVEKVQAVYDLLSEDDNLFRKAAFVKWVKEFANASFTDSTKKFSKNINPNSVKKNYQEDVAQGSELLAQANNKPFWTMEMSDEKTEKTFFDSVNETAEKYVKRIAKDTEKGTILKDSVVSEIESLMSRLAVLTQPLTTKAIMASAELESESESNVESIAA